MKLVKSNSLQPGKAVSLFEASKTGEVTFSKRGLSFDNKSSVTAGMEYERPYDFAHKFKYASKALNISDDPKDYLVVPVPIFITDLPNRNGVAFPAKALASYSVEYGRPWFKTWTGKPTYYEHKNDNPLEAKGLILDSVMNKVRGFDGFYKVVLLLSFDRTKDRQLYESIVNGSNNAYSMGAYVGHYKCSVCGNTHTAGEKPRCSHIQDKKVNFYDFNGRLAYLELHDTIGFETSAVIQPAFSVAISDFVNPIDHELRDRPK